MMNHSVTIMMMQLSCLTEDYTSVYTQMIDINPLDQNLVLKIYIIKQDLQLFNIPTNSPEFSMFLTVVLLVTLRHDQLKNENLFCTFTTNKPQIEKPDTNLICDQNPRKDDCLFPVTPSTSKD